LSERLTRIQVYIKGCYELKGNKGECNIVDISEGGIGIDVRQALVIGDLVHVIFKIPAGKEEEVDFWGIVRNVNNTNIGLKYEEITHDNIGRIDGFVSSLLTQSGKRAKENFES
jgi:hypothetical protein